MNAASRNPRPTMSRRAGLALAPSVIAQFLRASVFSVLSVAAGAAAAQSLDGPLPADPVLSRLISEGVAARPELAKAEALVRAEEARIPQASALPDPMLQVGIQNDGFTSIEIGRMGTSYVSLMASQTFPWAGKRGLRASIAKLDVVQASNQVLRGRLATEAEIRRDYLDLLLVRDRLELLDQLQASWRKSLAVARIMYEAGSGAQSDMLRAQLELNRIQQRRFVLQGEEKGRLQSLNRLRNRPFDEPIHTTLHLRDLTPSPALASRFSAPRAVRRSPEVASARAEIRRAGQSVQLAEKSYYPDLTVGAGIMVRGQLPPMWLVTVGGPIPVFSGKKQAQAVAENRAREVAAEKDATATEQLVRFRSEERRLAFSVAMQSIDLYRQGILVQSEATAESTLAQYTVGKVPFASVLEANAGFIADQEAYLSSIATAQRILIAEAENSLAPGEAGGGGSGSSAGPSAAAGSASSM